MVINWTYRAMENKARMLIEKYCPECLSDCTAVPIEKIADKLGLDIEYQYLTKNGNKTLGKLICIDGVTPYYDMDEKKYMFLPVKADTILIEVRLLENGNNGRYRFTVSHEVAHKILHEKHMIEAQKESAFSVDMSDTKMERQADYFASVLLMPMPAIKKYYYSQLGKHRNTYELVDVMAKRFDVSKQAMRIRLESHKMI